MTVDLKKQWICGAIAGSVEAVLMMPFEVLKTKLQVQGGGGWALLFNKNMKLTDAFTGLTPMLMQTSMKVGIRFAAYEHLKKYTSLTFAGFGAGAFEALVWIAPTERLKVLMINGDHVYKSFSNTLFLTVKNQGPFGLWRGAMATVLRNSSTVGARFWIVEAIKPSLSSYMNDSSTRNAVAGFLAGATTTILNQPIDVVKTRMNADRVGSSAAKYQGNLDCAIKVWNEGGVRAYSSGVTARLCKISLGQAIIFYVYDFTSRLF